MNGFVEVEIKHWNLGIRMCAGDCGRRRSVRVHSLGYFCLRKESGEGGKWVCRVQVEWKSRSRVGKWGW